jgi:CHAD domain-containing protein
MSSLAFDLRLDPADAPRLHRLPEFSGATRARRPVALRIVWHDTPDGALAQSGLSLAEQTLGRETSWRLERMSPAADELWIPGTQPPLLCQATDLADMTVRLARRLPTGLMPCVGFEGQVRSIALPDDAPHDGHPSDAVHVSLISGQLRTPAAAQAICRMKIDGPATRVAPLVGGLAESVGLAVPAVSLAAEARALACVAHPAARLGAPTLPDAGGPDAGGSGGSSIDEAFAHIVGHLLGVILHYAARALSGEAPEPVHQMRVALRRLRSAFGLFKDVVGCSALDAAQAQLKAFGAVLGPARDWDVFIDGACAHVVAVFPDDLAVRRMAARATRQRDVSYRTLAAELSGMRFRRMALNLALLAATRPWRDAAASSLAEPADEARQPPPECGSAKENADLSTYAARALTRRLKRVLTVGADISDLPADALHDIRLNGKRLRYAAEFFAPLFPGRDTRRFLRRMTALQERLGHLNDGNVAAGLMAEIGLARSYAGGIVRGVIAADGADARGRIARSWKRFRRQEPFWE